MKVYTLERQTRCHKEVIKMRFMEARKEVEFVLYHNQKRITPKITLDAEEFLEIADIIREELHERWDKENKNVYTGMQ
jgi:hypothetical protein